MGWLQKQIMHGETRQNRLLINLCTLIVIFAIKKNSSAEGVEFDIFYISFFVDLEIKYILKTCGIVGRMKPEGRNIGSDEQQMLATAIEFVYDQGPFVSGKVWPLPTNSIYKDPDASPLT